MGMVTAKTLAGDYGRQHCSDKYTTLQEEEVFSLQRVKQWEVGMVSAAMVRQLDGSAHQTKDWIVRYKQAEKWIRYADPTGI